jgi:hypothetical protein
LQLQDFFFRAGLGLLLGGLLCHTPHYSTPRTEG